MAFITKNNLQRQIQYFQECGLLDEYHNITPDGAIVYSAKKYIENGNLKPPTDRNFRNIGEFNRILKVLIRHELAYEDTLSGRPGLVNATEYYIELLDRSELDGNRIISVNV